MRDSILPVVAVVGVTAFFVYVGVDHGTHKTQEEFRKCRHLLATGDSATAIRARPACARWTLPVADSTP